MNWTLQIDERHKEPVTDAAQLERRLRHLHEQATHDPLFAVLNAPDGSTLAVGLGRDVSVLSFTAPGGSPSKHVVDPQVRDDSLVTYRFLDHFSEMPARYATPVSAAINAAVKFFESGRLSNDLQWEDD